MTTPSRTFRCSWSSRLTTPSSRRRSRSAASDMVPGTGIPLDQWHLGNPAADDSAASSHNLTPGSTGRLMDPELSHSGDRGVQRWLYLGDQSASRSSKPNTFTCSACMRTRPSTLIPTFRSTPEQHHTPLSAERGASAGGFFRPLDAAFTAAGVPILGSVRDETSGGRSRYDGMNLSYRQRSFHKTDLTVNYTLARAVGYDEDGGSFRYYPRDPQNPLAPNEFGPSFNDERHHLTIAATAHLPWGLEFSPILQFGSARPYNPIAAAQHAEPGRRQRCGRTDCD